MSADTEGRRVLRDSAGTQAGPVGSRLLGSASQNLKSFTFMTEVFCSNQARLFGKHLVDTGAGGRPTVENESLNKSLIKKRKEKRPRVLLNLFFAKVYLIQIKIVFFFHLDFTVCMKREIREAAAPRSCSEAPDTLAQYFLQPIVLI